MNDQTSTPEQEMREIFANTLRSIAEMRDKVVSTVVSHSQLARDHQELRTRFDELSQRMTSVIQEAQKVREDLHLVISERDKYKRDAEEAHGLANIFEKERDEARNSLRDTQGKLAEAELNLSEAKRSQTQADTLVTRLRGDIDWTQEANKRLRDERDEARGRNQTLETALKEANDKLGTLQNTFKQLFPSSPALEAAKPVEVPETFRPSDYHTGDQQPHPLQSVGESEVQPGSESSGVNERIDQDNPVAEDKPTEETAWWKDRKRETGF